MSSDSSTPSVTEEAQLLLQRVDGRITPVRLSVLSMLLQAKAALSHQDIEQLAQQQDLHFDRVTLYRALDWLVEQGIAHKIAGTDRTWRYNAQAILTPQHAHFHCSSCQQVFCLESLQPALLLSLPSGYTLHSAELHLQGLCPECTQTRTALLS